MKALLRYAAAGLLLAGAAFVLGDYQTDVYRKLLLWVTLALGYNFLFGVAGQLTFSHFTFYGLGAYAVVILVTQFHLPLALAVLLTMVICVLVALVVAIPATRLEGFYLALASMAFAQLFVVLLNAGGALTGGTGGLADYRLPAIGGVHLVGPWYTVVIVALLLLTLATLWRLERSWFGRACRAVRDDAEAAAAMGVDVRRTKVLAYTVTSALAGLAGVVYAFVDNTVNPVIFGLENNFLLLFMVVVGGAGSHWGAVLGAVLLYLMPFVLSPLIGHHHALVFGLFMILAVMFQPRGLVGLLRWPRAPRRPPMAPQPAPASASAPRLGKATE